MSDNSPINDYISHQRSAYTMETLLPEIHFQNKISIRRSPPPLQRKGREPKAPASYFEIEVIPPSFVAPWRTQRRSHRVGLNPQEPLTAPSVAMRLLLAGAVLLSAAAYYVYLPLPSGVSEPWKLMLLDALFRSFMQAVRARMHRGQVDAGLQGSGNEHSHADGIRECRIEDTINVNSLCGNDKVGGRNNLGKVD